MSRPTIELIAIMKNEEKHLPRFLESFKPYVDKITLVDTGSTDRSVEIAKNYGVNVEHFQWCNDFSAARNYSFSKASCDFILWADLDDALGNPEGFVLWRDTVMELGDYHLVNYNYAYDASGASVCTFVRERVVRRSHEFKWSYFLHEGIKIDSVLGNPRVNFCPTWTINHQRTSEDLTRDKGRNLKMFNGREDSLDPRMQYYYGKELFEANQPVEAINWLLKAASETTLEPHDRLLALQYASYAYMACNQFSKARDTAMMGLQLDSTRAEYHVVIADCWLKEGKMQDALPFYEAARRCTPKQGPLGATAIFSHPDAYFRYPTLQIGRIHAQHGNFDAAVVEFSKVPGDESEALIAECEKFKTKITILSNPKKTDEIVISGLPTGPFEWDGEMYKTKFCGGSETAAIEMAQWLKKLTGRPVKVFNARQSALTSSGVEYLPVSGVTEYLGQTSPKVHIAWRHSTRLTNAPSYLWCHDLFTQGGENQQNYDKMMCLTPFHKRFVQVMQGLPDSKIWVTRNGIDPTKFIDGPWAKDPNKFVFSSSPDRGLDRAMLVLDKVREDFPDIKLHIYYGIEHLHKYGPQMAALAVKLKTMMNERKDWVVYHGAVNQNELLSEFKSAAYCVQPSDFIETSMISAMERLCCGVYQIIRSTGGVVDTLAAANKVGMARLVESDCITESQYQRYVDETKAALKEEAYKRIDVDPRVYSWEAVAQDWIKEMGM